MLPTILNTSQGNGISHLKSFNETLCEGYHFEVKNDIKCSGSRSLFYCKEEHSLLISHFFSSRVHILNLETGKLRWFNHHGTTVRSVQVCDHEIITTSWDGTVCITGFDILEKRMVLTERDMGRCPFATISPDKKSLFSYSYDSDKNPHFPSNTVREWSLVDGRLKRTFPLSGTHLSPDGRFGACKVFDNRLFVVSDTGHFYIYDSITGTLLSEYVYYDQLQSLCLFPYFNQLVIGGGEGNIYLHDLDGHKILCRRKAHKYSIPQLLVHPDKPEIMISVSFDGIMKIWKLPELELLESVEVSRDRLWNVTAVNDLLITGGDEEVTSIYDIKSLPQVILKGKLILSDESYAFIPGNSRNFFTNNPSIMQVRRDCDGTLPDGRLAEYLINSACDLKALRDMFSAENNDQSMSGISRKGFYQITQ
jgi:WD40 repeat protein